MLILFETPAVFALFQVEDGILQKVDKIYSKFQDISTAKQLVTLKNFSKFEDTTEALVSTTALLKGKMGSSLKNFLNESIVQQNIQEKLGVIDKALAKSIKKKTWN